MMKRIALVSAALLATGAAAAPAQDPPPAPPPSVEQQQEENSFAQRRLKTLLHDITLTAVQRASVDSIARLYAGQLPRTPPDSTSDEAILDRWRAVLPRMDGEIRAVLSASQQRVWDRNVQEWNRQFRGVG